MVLAAWARAGRQRASELIQATVREAAAGGLGVSFAAYARFGARQRPRPPTTPRATPPWRAFEHDQLGYGAVRRAGAGRGGRQGPVTVTTVRTVLAWLSERHPGDTVRVGAGDRSPPSAPLLSGGETADRLYRESISRLGRTRRPRRARPALTCSTASGCAASAAAPTRRAKQLRTAHDMLGCDGRGGVRRGAPAAELAATGEEPRASAPCETAVELTAQEAQVARAGPGRPVQPGDRPPGCSSGPRTVKLPPGQGLHQARHQLPAASCTAPCPPTRIPRGRPR